MLPLVTWIAPGNSKGWHVNGWATSSRALLPRMASHHGVVRRRRRESGVLRPGEAQPQVHGGEAHDGKHADAAMLELGLPATPRKRVREARTALQLSLPGTSLPFCLRPSPKGSAARRTASSRGSAEARSQPWSPRAE